MLNVIGYKNKKTSQDIGTYNYIISKIINTVFSYNNKLV